MANDFDKRLGAELRHEREKRGIGQQEVADKLAVTNSAISHWETGIRSMYAYQVKAYCKAVGCDIDEVFSRL